MSNEMNCVIAKARVFTSGSRDLACIESDRDRCRILVALCWTRGGSMVRVEPGCRTRITTTGCSALHLCSMLAALGDVSHSLGNTMQRFTARLLLLFALAGTFVPLALAATAAPAHACCVRNTHHCHSAGLHTDTSAQSDELILHSAGCCNHDCCRGVTLTHSASPQSNIALAAAELASQLIQTQTSDAPGARFSSSQSTRAPPQLTLA
jgi:hypothetical protein